MAFTNAWDESAPLGTQNASLVDNYLRQHRLDLGERLESMFYGFNTSDNSDEENEHGIKSLKLFPQTTPTTDSDYGFLYGKTVSSAVEAHYKDSAGNEVQLTSGGVSSIGYTVTAKTADYTVKATECKNNVCFANTGTTGVVTFTLPAGVAGYRVQFLVTDTDGIRIDPPAGVSMRLLGTTTTAAKYIQSSETGTFIDFVFDGTYWTVVNIVGGWTDET